MVLGLLFMTVSYPSMLMADSVYAYVKDGQIVLTDKEQKGLKASKSISGPTDSKSSQVRVAMHPPKAGTVYAEPVGYNSKDRWDDLIYRAAQQHGVSPELVKAVIWAESNFDAAAVSHKGAIGLMQLMPATAKQYGITDPRMLRDPARNISVGTQHLRDLLDLYDGNVTLALAAYNAGVGAVKKYRGVPAYRETQNYVRKISRRLGEHGMQRAAGARPIRAVASADGSLSFEN